MSEIVDIVELVDTVKDSLGELGDLIDDLGMDIWNPVPDIQDDWQRETTIKEAAEEAMKQVKATEKAEDFSRARKKKQTWKEAVEEAQRQAEEEAREMPRKKTNKNTKRRSGGNKRQTRTRKGSFQASGTRKVIKDSTVAEILKAARNFKAAEESRRREAREL